MVILKLTFLTRSWPKTEEQVISIGKLVAIVITIVTIVITIVTIVITIVTMVITIVTMVITILTIVTKWTHDKVYQKNYSFVNPSTWQNIFI